MPPKIDLELYRDTIERYVLAQRLTASETRKQLEQEHGICISDRTLRRALAAWEVHVTIRRDPSQDTELRARVVTLFYQWQLVDKDMAEILRYDGFKVSARSLQVLRLSMGLTKRVFPWQEEELDIKIQEVLQQEYNDGAIEDYGKNHLYQYIREKYHIIGRYALASDSLSTHRWASFLSLQASFPSVSTL